MFSEPMAKSIRRPNRRRSHLINAILLHYTAKLNYSRWKISHLGTAP